jgi:hypothetical protein
MRRVCENRKRKFEFVYELPTLVVTAMPDDHCGILGDLSFSSAARPAYSGPSFSDICSAVNCLLAGCDHRAEDMIVEANLQDLSFGELI